METPSPVTCGDLAAVLPPVTAASAAWSRLLHDIRLQPVWSAIAGLGDLSVVRAAGAGPGSAYDLMIECDAGVVALAVMVDHDAPLAMISAAGLSPALRARALNAFFQEAVDRLAQLALPGATVVALTPLGRHAAPSREWCAVRHEDVEWCRISVLEIPLRVREALLAVRGAAPLRGGWRRRLRLPTALVIAERRLSIAMIRSLEVGDVVLPSTKLTTLAKAHIEWRAGRNAGLVLCAKVVLDDRSITFLGDLRMTDDADSAAASTVPGDALDALELPVHFELETVSIPLADLESVEPGYVIELGTPASQSRLRLVACGVVIGEADLVAIGGRLGARITQLVDRR